MSAETSGDLCHTNDEEVLRKMWQDTEDFGKKKEIRSHMYKLREERLRNFYNSTDPGTEIRTTQQASSLKEGNVPTHADSLLDQGFMSLKSKEIRDSESPTKDMHHFRVIETNRGGNQGWDVVSKNEVSQDGKTHTSMKMASTSGSDKIDKGVANYSAQCEQKSSVFQDGDDNNFTKSASNSSKSVLRQEAKGGDDNSSFHSSSTSTSNSSRVVSQHHTTSDTKPRSSADNQELVVRKTYTTDVPAELKRSPNYIDGNTTVTTETRTLADGTKVTTTRYETKGVSSKINQQNFHTSTTKTVNDSQTYQTRRNDTTNLDQRYVIRDVPDGSDQRPTESPKGQRPNTDSRCVDKEMTTTHSVEDHVNQKVIHDKKDDVYITKMINEKEYNPREKPAVNEVVRTSGNIESKTVTNSKTTKVMHDDRYVTQKNQDVRYHVTTEPESAPPRAEVTPNGRQPVDGTPATPVHMTTVHTKNEIVETVKSDVGKLPQEPREPLVPSSIDQIPQEYLPYNRKPGECKPTEERTSPTYRPPEQEIVPNLYSTPKPMGDSTVVQRTIKTTTTTEKQPDRINTTIVVKPQTEKVTTVSSQTTYKADYTAKRISVDISPTHDAFARSLRASPDREPKHGNVRSLKSSTTSLRSSTSPDKTYPYNRYPETSSLDRKQPSRFSPTKSKPDSRESSPIKKLESPIPKKTSTDSKTNTTTRRHNTDTKETRRTYDSSTITRQTKGRPRSRSVSPTTSASDIEFVRNVVVTDLDEHSPDRRTPSHATSEPKNFSDGPITKSPTKKHPEKDLQLEKPFKRRDTYEERCRQILGINQESKTQKKPEDRKSPEKKPGHQIQEYPSQVRRTSEKKESTANTEHKTVKKDSPGGYNEPLGKTVDVTRRTPEKHRKSPEFTPSCTRQTEESYITQKTVTPKRQPGHPVDRAPAHYGSETDKTVDRNRVTTKTSHTPQKGKRPSDDDTPKGRYPGSTETDERYTQETVTTNRVTKKSSARPTDEDIPKGRTTEKYPGSTKITTEETVIRGRVITKPGDEPKKVTPTSQGKHPKGSRPIDQDFPSDGEETDKRYTKATVTTNRIITSSTSPTDDDLPEHRKPKDRSPVKYPERTEVTTEETVITSRDAPHGKQPKGSKPVEPKAYPGNEEETEDLYTEETAVTRNRITTKSSTRPVEDDLPDNRRPHERLPEKYPGSTEITTKETVIRGRVTTKPGDEPKKVTPVTQGKHPKASWAVDQTPEDYPSDSEETEDRYTQETVTKNRITTKASTHPTYDGTPEDRKPKGRYPEDSEITQKTVVRVTKPGDEPEHKHPKGSQPVDSAPEDYPKHDEETEERYTQDTVTTNRTTTKLSTRPTDHDIPKHRQPKDCLPQATAITIEATVIRGHVGTKPSDVPKKITPIPHGKYPKGNRAPGDLPSDEEETEERYTQKTVTRNHLTTQTDGDSPDHRKPKDRSPLKHPLGSVVTTKETVIRGHVTVETPTKGTPIPQGKHRKGIRPVDRAPEDLPSDEEETEERYTQETVTKNRITTESSTLPTDDDIPDHGKPKDRSPLKHPGGSVVTTKETIIKGHVTTKPGEPKKSKPIPLVKHPKGSPPDDRAPEDLPSDEEETEERYTQETVTRNRITTESSTRPTDDDIPDHRKPKDRSPLKHPGSSVVTTKETVIRGHVTTKPVETPTRDKPISQGKHPKGSRPVDRAPEDLPTDEEVIEGSYTQKTVTTDRTTTKSSTRPTDGPEKWPPKDRSPEKWPGSEIIRRETVTKGRASTKPDDEPKKLTPMPHGKHPKGSRPADRAPEDYPSDCEETEEGYTEETVIRNRITKAPEHKPKDRLLEKYPEGTEKTKEETVIGGRLTTKPGDAPKKVAPVSHGKPRESQGSRPIDRSLEDYSSDIEHTDEHHTHSTLTKTRVTSKPSDKPHKPEGGKPGNRPIHPQVTEDRFMHQARDTIKHVDLPKRVVSTQERRPKEHPCQTETIDDFYTLQTVVGKPKQHRAPEDHPYETEETDERYTVRVTTKSSETPKKHSPTPVGKERTNGSEPKGKKPHVRSTGKYPGDTETTQEFYTQKTVVRDHETTKPGERPTERPKHGQPDREYPTDETSECYTQETVSQKRVPGDVAFPREKHPTPKSTKPGKRLVTDETTSRTMVTIQSKNKPRQIVPHEREPQTQKPTDVSDSSDEEPFDESPHETVHITQETDDYYVSQTGGHTTTPGDKPTKGSRVVQDTHFEPEEYPSDTEETQQVYVTKDTIRRTSDQKVSTRQPNKRPIGEQSKPMHREPSSRVTKETPSGQTTTQKTTVTKKTTGDFVPKRRSPERDSYKRKETDERHSQQVTVQARVNSKPDNKPKKPQPRSEPRIPSDTSSRVTQRYVAQATIDRTRMVSKPSGKPKYEEPRRPDDYPTDTDERDERVTKKPAGKRPEVSPYYRSEGTHYIAASRTVVTDERKPAIKSPDRKTSYPVQESKPKKRVPKEEVNEITRRSPGKRPVVEETIQTRDTYLTTDKATVHRRNKVTPEQEPAVKKPGGAKPTINRQTPHEDNYCRDDDFYTLNIKVYRNDLKTGRDKHSPKPVPSELRERTKTDKTTVYRTEEKHFVNKTTRKPGKADSSDRDSPVTQIVRSQKPTKARDVKPKPDATRHVVTTTIQVVPKKKTKEPAAKASPKVSKGGSKPMPKDQVETDEEFVDENYIVEEHEESTDRAFDRQITRTITTPERVLVPKSRLPTSTRPTDTLKRPEKVITTKSIVINSDLKHGKEVIVNLQRSKSSREATPDRSCAYPASDNEDKGVPRYPDEICEPDDPRRKPTKLSDIPIIETEDSGYLNKVDETDDCLLSVNEKVNKFVNEADKLRTNKSSGSVIDRLKVTQQSHDRPKSPKCQNYSEDEDERFTSVSEKVSHFIETAEKFKTHQNPQKPKVTRPEFRDFEENIKSDNCLLSVSDKVTKFSTASPNYKTPVSLSKMDAPRTTPSLITECVQIDTEEDMYRRKPAVDEPRRKISEPDTTPKSSRKNSETKTVLSTTGRLRSTETIRKAKEIFENAAKDQTPVKPRRPIVEDELKSTRLIIDKINKPHYTETDDTPGYMRPLNRSPRPHSPDKGRSPSRGRSRSPSAEKPHDPALDKIPHYMWPLDRTVHSPDRDTSRESSPSHSKPIERAKSPRPSDIDVSEKRTKSTASLRKVDTEKVTTKHRSFTSVEIEEILSVNEIEDIYEIEILEVLLEWAVSYEQRRRVRSQIRVVKQLIIEHKLPKVLYKKSRRSSSPKYKEVVTRKPSSTTHEEHIVHSYSERKRSTEIKTYSREVSPETKIIRKTPEPKPFKPELKRVEPVSKKVMDEKPSWVTQRPLKKSSGDIPKAKSVSTTKKLNSRVSPPKERKPTDAITSSYGVGPTDENGSPLFGLKALRAQTQTGTTKVQGTVIKSHYYSENGHEPTGEISVTNYSNDPNDFEGEVDETEGLVSVTTTQRFGKGTPSQKAITDCEYYPEDDKIEEYESRKSSSTSVTRRGSVKQMSKKFIDNAVETSKTERQTSYPKAGLILRTSSFKKSSPEDREPSPEGTAAITTAVRKTTTTTSSGRRGDTFLNNQTRVRDVQDVITRMKNSDDDLQEGDTAEDVEARKLLNKFIGSQVILSGMETQSSSPTSSTVRRTTTTTTTTTKGGGKPTVVTRTFTHPITREDLETIWDEPTLKLLLERSVDYEERRIIRGRLRDIMAEKEVCADPKSNQESSERVEEVVEKTEGPLTTTQVTTSRVTSQQISKKPMSPFAKFKQLDKQNSLNTPPGTPRTPKGSAPLFKFTDPELNRQAMTVKERLLQWCQMKTKEYENVQLDNFSSSWADGLAFCALIHHFLPDAFDYHALTPKERRHNFTLAFRVADEKADIVPLLDVDDMIATRKPDWKCVFTYVQTIYARFKNED